MKWHVLSPVMLRKFGHWQAVKTSRRYVLLALGAAGMLMSERGGDVRGISIGNIKFGGAGLDDPIWGVFGSTLVAMLFSLDRPRHTYYKVQRRCAC